jgi:hypothetical protein
MASGADLWGGNQWCSSSMPTSLMLRRPRSRAERQAGPVEDERLASPELGLGPVIDPHDGRVGGLRTSHEQHLHWEVFYVVALVS